MKQVPTEVLRQVLDAFRLWSHNPDGLTVLQELQINDALNTVKAILDEPSEPKQGNVKMLEIHSDAFLDQERAGEV